MVCPHGQGGGGEILRDLMRTSFMHGLLTNADWINFKELLLCFGVFNNGSKMNASSA